MRLKQFIFALTAMLLSFVSVNAQEGIVAKIGNNEYTTFASAMTDANAATGNVIVEVYGNVDFVDGMELNGSYTSITFTGKSDGAQITINQTAGGDYLTAHGKTVAFNDLILAKANPAWSGNSGHMGNYFSVQGGTVTYNSCTFPNGACTSGGTATYTGCTFQNASEYGLWVYDDALVTVDGGTVDSKKGIKVYSEDEASVTSTLTVQNATFTENVTEKPAVAVGYAQSITLIGNTYNNTTAVVELDSGSDADCEGIVFVAQDSEGNDIASTLEMTDRSNSSAACGVLVDGKIYTTVTTAAAEATSGSTVTLLYNTTETVELPEGVTLDRNGFTADNVTVATSGVAKIGETTYKTLQAAIDAVQNGETIEFLGDITETLVTIEKASGVAFTIDGKGNSFTGEFEIGIGENINIQNINFVASAEISPEYFIDSMDKNSNCVLNITGCTFTDTDYSTTAIGTHQPTEVVIDGCTTSGVASLLQNQGGYNITVKNTTVEGKRGISLGTVVGATVEKVTIKAADDKYGIRLNGEITDNTITIKDCDIQAFIPVVVRKAQVENYNVIFDGTNTMTAKNTDGLWCAIGASEYETNGVMPDAPTGKVTVTLNDTGLSTQGLYGNYAPAVTVAKISDVEYSDFAEALTAASAMSGDVTVEVYDKVTLNTAFSGSYSSINFVGKDTDAEIYLDVQGYITATGKKVSFADLTLSKSQGSYMTNAGFMNVAFGIYDVTEVTYTDCVFANGAYASSGNVTFNGCTFYRSYDKYGLWAYGNVDATVEGCTFADYRGIKMYAEDKAKTTGLTVKKTDFSAVTDKPAIVLTYGESVVLEGNTYSSTGTFELDLDGAPNGTAVTSDVAPTCKNDNGACGVLVDGKIYTTVAQAAEVATEGSNVTLLYSTTDAVEFAEGVNLTLADGVTADNVTVATSGVAKIGETTYKTLATALAEAQDGDVVTLVWTEGDDAIAMNGSLYGKKVTITGTATVDWNKGFLFVGRGGNGDATLTFDGANLTSASNSASYGIHVSGREKGTDNKYNGTLEIKNSTIELDYLINKNTMSLDNSTLTVKNGFSIGGRPASETESGADATATISLANNSKVIVNNHNGMGLGYEAIGVMNIDTTSTFEATQPFLVTAKGTMNVAAGGAVSVNGTLTVNGTLVSAGNIAAEIAAGDGATIEISGGVYTQDVNNWCADGYAALPDLNGNYVVGAKPTATVNNLGMTTVAAGDYMVYGNGDNTADMPLSFVMQFLADQKEEDMKTSPYADWYGDFVITFTGIENGSFTADGCYLAGHYGSFGWVKVPVDGMTIEEGARYPVMLGVGMGQKYNYICSSVQDFKCALYLTPEILEANPNIKVKLELAVVDNSKDSDAAASALINNENVYSVTDYTYNAEDFVVKEYVAKIGETGYRTLAEAIAAIGAGDVVIELLADATFDYNARDAYGTAETTSVTINGNGHTLTLNQKNSDWASLGLANAAGKLAFNNVIIEKTGYGDTSGAWNTHAIIFSCPVEMTDVTVNQSMAVQAGATLNNVTINEANGYYGLWINGNGQSVTVNGGAINATNGGRGIKIADEYIDAPAQVTLNVTGTEFNTAKKAAVLVTSTAGAQISASNVDITNVAADNVNFVWVDEDRAAYYNNIKVYDEATKAQENEESFPIKVWYVNDEGVASSVRAYYKNLDDLFVAPATQVPGSNRIELRGDVAAANKVNVSYGSNRVYSFVTDIAEGVTMTFNYVDNWNMLPKFNLGENITMNVKYLQVIGGDIEIAGNLVTDYLYLYGTGEGVTITETGVVTANTGDATVQVKGGTVLTVNGKLTTSTLNVWTQDVNNSELIVSGANAQVTAAHLHAWNGKDGVSAQKVNVENGATLTATNFQADRGSEVTVADATVNSDAITLGYDNNIGKLTETGNSTINGPINLNSTAATVASDGGLNVTTDIEGYKVVYDAVNKMYKVVPERDLSARIGENYYESLTAALNAAVSGDTITFLKDITEDVAVTKSVTIDGNGKQYTGNIAVSGNTTAATVKNVNFVDGSGYAITTNRIKSITVENCTVNNYGFGFLYANKSTPTVTVKDVTVDGGSYGFHWVYGTSATLENVKMTNVTNGLLIQNYADKTITLDNCEICSIAIWERDGYSGVQTFKLEGCNTITALPTSQYAKFVGATIDGTSYYGSVQGMVEKAENGETVTLLSDIAMTTANYVTITDNYATLCAVKEQNVTIDLNGKVITVNASAADVAGAESGMLFAVFAVDTNGNLTITDSSNGAGAVNVVANDAPVYCLAGVYGNGGKLTIENGSYTADMLSNCLIYAQHENCVTVNNGNYHLGNVGTGANGSPWIFNTYGKNVTGATVNGGTFNTDINHQFWANEVYVPETLALKDNGDGTWTVVPSVAYNVERATSSYSSDRKVGYATLADAVAAVKAEGTVTLVADATGAGVVIDKDVTIDFNEKTYTVNQAVGSAGTETLGFQILKDNNVTLMNGTLTSTTPVVEGKEVKMLIQNYANLTLEDMNLVDATDHILYVLSNNCGETELKGETNITTDAVAFDSYKYGSYAAPTVYVNTTGKIEGAIEKNEGATIAIANGTYTTPVLPEWCAEGYAPCDNEDDTYGVYYAVLDEVHFVDGEFTEFNNGRNMTVGTLTYERSSIPTTWTPFYVPFEVPVSQLAEQGFEVAYINGVRRDDNNFDGELDEFVMEVIYIHGGNADGSAKTLKANYPYFIRSKGSESIDLYIELEDALLYAAKNATYDCTTMTEKFEITGNASQIEINSTADALVYGVSGGGWTNITTGATLKPFRFYMTLTSRDGSAPVTTAASMSIVVRGEELPDGTTLIYDINAETGDNVIYDLYGRRVLETEKGNIYIINGKKVLVK